MEPIQLIFWSPIAAILFAVLLFVLTHLGGRKRLPRPFPAFAKIVLGWAFSLCAVSFAVSLTYSIMVEASTGPLGAIFFFGPLGFTLGVVVGLCLWFFWHRNA
jgi:hypothetical protein